MGRARIDWTPFEADEDWTAGEEDSCADGSDQVFYGMPFCEADEGDVFACWNEGDSKVTMGRKDDDSISFWEVLVGEALDRLKATRADFPEEGDFPDGGGAGRAWLSGSRPPPAVSDPEVDDGTMGSGLPQRQVVQGGGALRKDFDFVTTFGDGGPHVNFSLTGPGRSGPSRISSSDAPGCGGRPGPDVSLIGGGTMAAPLKKFAERILELAAASREIVDEGCFTCGRRRLVLLKGEPEIPNLDSGWILAFEEDVDGNTGRVSEGAETWKVNVSLVSTKDDGRAGWYGEYVRCKRRK